VKYPVVKPFLPDLTAYQSHISDVFDANWLTNSGPKLQALESALADYLGVDNLLLVANGTLALQVAIEALGIKSKVLTTPFTFAATASAALWQNRQVEFIDVDAGTWNLDPGKLPEKPSSETGAILGVHVFGNACDVESIQAYADKHELKVIYDAAHAFGSDYQQESVLKHGDACTLSLHATKLFHTVEGGAIIFKHREHYLKAKQLINFGFDQYGSPIAIGINAKMSEMHASMGLSLFPQADFILNKRNKLYETYYNRLKGIRSLALQQWQTEDRANGSYMPMLCDSKQDVDKLEQALAKANIGSRRYFSPSLSKVKTYGGDQKTPVADDIADRVICVPMYTDLAECDVHYICDVITESLSS
jgi:dTDP-4-amino-4,6-dideoxygalactose transaminase